MIYITRTGNKMEGTVQNLFCVTTAEFGWSYWGNLRKSWIRIEGPPSRDLALESPEY